MGAALARHDEILRSAIVASGGHVFSTAGDGVGAVFGRAASAITAALTAQRELSAEAWVGGPVLRVRMGVHTGEAEERDGDFFGRMRLASPDAVGAHVRRLEFGWSSPMSQMSFAWSSEEGANL